jgi:multidrug efflux pump subunit AcrB
MASALFFRHGHLLVLSILVILVAGVSAIFTLPRLEDPRIDLRNVIILTPFPGASAQRVEALVTDVLEDELRTLFEIKKLTSTSSAGFSSISVELQDWVDDTTNQQIFSKIRDAIADASTRFPVGASTPVLDDKRGATAFTQLVAIKPHAKHPVSLAVVSRLADEMSDRFRNISGTELVRIFGAPQEEVVVEIDPNQLAMAGLTVGEVSQLIRQADPKLPSGSLFGSDYNIRIQVAQGLDSIDTIRSIPLVNNQGSTLRLGDIASVKKRWQTPESSIMLVDSQRVVTVAARMQTNVRVDKWTQQANAVIAQFRSQFGDSVDVEVVFEQNLYTQARLEELTTNLLLGSLVVMLVILLFMGWRASFIVGLALPLCASFTLFSLSFFGEQIHQMSIFGIIIAIGLLIDNAIVITDEIRINLQKPGASRIGAMRKAVKHLFIPLSASTITTVLGFMPIFLLNGNIGDFIGPIAISVVMALVGSLVISLTIIAALAARYLPSDKNIKSFFTGIDLPEVSSSFERCVLWAVRRPKRIVVCVVVFCISGFVFASQLANVFFPSADRNQFQVYVWSNFGQSIYETHDAIKGIDHQLKRITSVEQVTWHIGGSTPSVYYNQVMGIENRANYANAVITTDSVKTAAELTATLQQTIQDTHPDLRVVVRGFGQGPPIFAPVEIEIFGPDLVVLNDLGQQVRLAMSKIGGITQSIASIAFTEPEFILQTNQDIAATVGVSLDDISVQLNRALRGETNGSLLQGTEDIPIRVRMSDEVRSAPSSIGGLPILSSQRVDQWASVDTIGELVLQPAISSITRVNGERLNKVQAFLLPGVPAVDVSNQLRNYLAENLTLPAGYRLSMSGDADQQNQAIGQLAAYLPVLLVLMITTLILTFSSVRLAVVIGAVAVLSVGLGFLSLWLSGLPIGFNPILGSAGLIGVTINGSIVVIAAIKANKRARTGDKQEIVKETMSCSRHILSTTLTTVGGLIPLLIFAQGSFWPPLAVVIAGGVGFSVVLSLFFTPAVVALLTRHNRAL